MSHSTRYNDSPNNPTYEKQTPSDYCVRSRAGLLRGFHREWCHKEIGVADSEPERFSLAEDQGFAGSQDLHLAGRQNNKLAGS